MKKQINEFKRMQLIAGLITESEYRQSLLNEDSLKKTISFGPYTNLTYYDQPREDTVYLVVDTSDNFTKIARAVDTKGKDFYTKKQILYLNDKLEDLADEMSDYLTKQGIENEVVDSPEGYGQEIDNLEIEISKDDLSKLRMTESQMDEAEDTNILPFLKSHKQELLDKLAKMLEWDEDDIEAMEEDELVGGIDGTDENEDTKVAGFKYIGLQFSFDPEDLENEEDAAEFKLNIAGKPVYGLYYSM